MLDRADKATVRVAVLENAGVGDENSAIRAQLTRAIKDGFLTHLGIHSSPDSVTAIKRFLAPFGSDSEIDLASVSQLQDNLAEISSHFIGSEPSKILAMVTDIRQSFLSGRKVKIPDAAKAERKPRESKKRIKPVLQQRSVLDLSPQFWKERVALSKEFLKLLKPRSNGASFASIGPSTSACYCIISTSALMDYPAQELVDVSSRYKSMMDAAFSNPLICISQIISGLRSRGWDEESKQTQFMEAYKKRGLLMNSSVLGALQIEPFYCFAHDLAGLTPESIGALAIADIGNFTSAAEQIALLAKEQFSL